MNLTSDPDVAPPGANSTAAKKTRKRLTVSILYFKDIDGITRLLSQLPDWLYEFSVQLGIDVSVVIRQNAPDLKSISILAAVALLAERIPELEIILIDEGHNVGFGRGHNENFRVRPADYFLVLNDDIAFPHLHWLPVVVGMLDESPRLAAVGDASNPKTISPLFANGQFDSSSRLSMLQYAEASVLMLRGQAFAEAGMFDDEIEWAMCEDADLSLRLQSLGWTIDWMSFPHQHWRSSSFNSIPQGTKNSILEHNRSRMFARWGSTMATGVIGSDEVFDVSSDGIGDVFCALVQLAVYFETYTAQQLAGVVLNTSSPDLARMLMPAGVRILSEENANVLRDSLGDEATAIRSIRNVNYALPFDMFTLTAAALSIPRATGASIVGLWEKIRLQHPAPKRLGLPKGYCVVHLESARVGHDGRAPDTDIQDALLLEAIASFGKVVLIGLDPNRKIPTAARDGIVDLRGKTSIVDLVPVMAEASAFVGIDSLPAHVAQAAKLPAAIFFGSVHPATRTLDMGRVWPIVAPLECIGCYHTDIEPTVPFCMRRDIACGSAGVFTDPGAAIRDMASGKAADWGSLMDTLRDRQTKLVHLLMHHPRPPEMTFRQRSLPNEVLTHAIYRTLDDMADLITNRYAQAERRNLRSKIDDLEAQLVERRGDKEFLRQSGQVATSRAIEQSLVDRVLSHEECSLHKDENGWLVAECLTDDPKIFFRPLELEAGAATIRVRAVALSGTVAAQLFVSINEESFSEQASVIREVDDKIALITRSLKVNKGDKINIRFDPSMGRGQSRFQISVKHYM